MNDEWAELWSVPKGNVAAVNDAYRRIVLRNPDEYPTLAKVEMAKNAYRFQAGSQ